MLELEGEFSWIPFIGAIQFWLQDKLACMLGYIRLGAICKNKLNQAGNTLISLFQQTDSSVVVFLFMGFVITCKHLVSKEMVQKR